MTAPSQQPIYDGGEKDDVKWVDRFEDEGIETFGRENIDGKQKGPFQVARDLCSCASKLMGKY